MSDHRFRAGLGALFAVGALTSALTSGLTLAAAPAQAKAAAPCQVTGSSPSRINLGPKPQETRFKLTTDCPADAKIAWYYQAVWPDDVPHTERYPYIQLATYNVGPANWYSDPEGDYPVRGSSAG